jgi:hypothetical protein
MVKEVLVLVPLYYSTGAKTVTDARVRYSILSTECSVGVQYLYSEYSCEVLQYWSTLYSST